MPQVALLDVPDTVPSSNLQSSIDNLQSFASLHLTARRTRGHHRVADVEVKCVAAIVGAGDTTRLRHYRKQHPLLYCELVGGHTEVEAVLAGFQAEPSITTSFTLTHKSKSWYVEPPPDFQVSNVRLPIPGWRRKIMHAAIVTNDGHLALVCEPLDLWHKVKANVTTPLMDSWADSLLPRIHDHEVVEPCDHFGLPDDLKPYAISPNATTRMDEIVSTFTQDNIWELITV